MHLVKLLLESDHLLWYLLNIIVIYRDIVAFVYKCILNQVLIRSIFQTN